MIFVELFCLTVPKKIVQESFNVSLVPVLKNFLHKRGLLRYFVEKFLSHSAEKNCRGIFWGFI